MLRTFPERYKSFWKNHLSKVIYAYNCTRHSSTGYSPYYLMLGRNPRLPIDLILRWEKDSTPRRNRKEYLESWKKEIEGAFEVALTKPTGKKRERYAKEAEIKTIEPGDKVLVRNLSPRGGPGKRKLRSFWEQEVAEVIQVHENDVTYTIKIISQRENVRTLNRNMLMPVNHISQTVDNAPNLCLMKIKPPKKESQL